MAMGDEFGCDSRDSRDEDDEDDYDEVDEKNGLLGFMFGNVDGSGDLDVDYLDEDAKEHLGALAEDLGPSLTDIDLSTKSTHISADASEQDYDEKAEDAVDYEDIEEQYEGPEVQAISEEDHLLSKKEFISAEVPFATVQDSTSVFGEENYDESEGEDFEEEHTVVDISLTAQTLPPAGTLLLKHSSEQPSGAGFERDLDSLEKGTVVLECSSEQPRDLTSERDLELSLDKGDNLELLSEEEKFPGNSMLSHEPFEADSLAVDMGDFQEEDEPQDMESSMDKSTASLPILCIEDGMAVLRFSEIFGIHEPLRKREKRNHRYPTAKERHKSVAAPEIVEEDEEAFLRESSKSSFSFKQAKAAQYDDTSVGDGDRESLMLGIRQEIGMSEKHAFEQKKLNCLSAEPMKDSVSIDLASGWVSPSCPKFYPLDQQDWEDEIIWNNSPLVDPESSKSCTISGVDIESSANVEIELGTDTRNLNSESQVEHAEKGHSVYLSTYPVLVEPFGSRKFSDSSGLPFSEMNHPQLLRLESRLELDGSNDSEVQRDNRSNNFHKDDAIRHFSKRLSLRNMDLLDGSWLDKIIWEPNEHISKPKLILDLQDEQMLFEILENKDGGNLQYHAGAMVITRSAKLNGGDSFDVHGQGGGASIGRFNISNDKYYSNRKISQQLKSHSKKRAPHGVKVLHSIPGLKLQTMKPKLSNKDIANFHRPKALWYPHDNEVAAKEQGKLSTQGSMKIILKSMGGKGTTLHVDAEEIVSSLKAKASKKLDFRPSEQVKIFYSGKELEDISSLATQNVRPNSVLHLVRTKVHLWPRAQKVPGENKSLRPPGAFKKKSDLSVKDGHVFLMEYCEERPLVLGNVGMGARLCTYYQKSAPGDQTASVLRNESGGRSLGTVIALDPSDKSPFLGDIRPGCTQLCLETNMYRAPVFPHRLPTTDYLLVRSAKGKLSLRRIDRVHVVGQQEPHMEVISPGTKNLQTYIGNRFLVYMYRECRANEKRGLPPCIRADELAAQFPNFTEPVLRKRLKHCADLQKGTNGQLFWVVRRNFRIPLEDELRRMVTPENVCSYESMQAGLYRLKRLGISRLTHPTGLSSAMNQLPDEAIVLAASSHIERELQITPWNLTSNFVSCTNQDRENIERLEITGVGDPSGRGLGFSYVRVAPKAPASSAMVKKKTAAPRVGGTTVTGTDADLRRLSMEGAREVLLKFNVPEEQIAKQTRWHRIAMIRKLSSEQASSGVKVDPTTIGKYARGQRMSFLQLQQQAREKCQEIWDRQLQSLSAAEGDENDSDSEANSDLDSFAGDLENLLDAEECGEAEIGSYESKQDKADGVRGLKMRRRPTQAQAEEEIEDEAAEAAELCRLLMDDDEAERRKKKKTGAEGRKELGLSWQSGFGSESNERFKKTNIIVKQIIRTAQPENIIGDTKEVENVLAKRSFSENIKSKKGNGKNDMMCMGIVKKTKLGDGFKVKKPSDKPVREGFVCGACGQSGHMRTNKNCPRYGEELDMQVESSGTERLSGKLNFHDSSAHVQPKPTIKKIIPKIATRPVPAEAPKNTEELGLKAKIPPLKLKYGLADKPVEQITAPMATHSSDKPDETGSKPVAKISKIIISDKMKSDGVHVEPQKPSSIVIRAPVDTERQQKKIRFKQPKGIINVDQVREVHYVMSEEHKKTKKMIELTGFEMQRKQENKRLADEAAAKRKAKEEKKFWEEEKKRRIAEVMMREEKERERILFEERMIQAEQQRLAEARRYNEALLREREEHERQKMKKRKKIKLDEMRDDYYVEEPRGKYRTNRRMPERNSVAKKRTTVESSGRFGPEYGQQSKRRRGGEGQVGLSNILDNILDGLKDAYEVSYLFLKPVSKKEAPDYLDIIEHPMDLSTIREKTRRMEYNSRDEFRHDVWQITYNAHKYNDNRNPGIPPLADQLLELCDYLLDQNHDRLTEAEAGI